MVSTVIQRLVSNYELHETSGGRAYSGVVKTQSVKSWPNSNFWENRVNWDFWTQIYPNGACHCITDSLSHTMYVETKKSFFIVDDKYILTITLDHCFESQNYRYVYKHVEKSLSFNGGCYETSRCNSRGESGKSIVCKRWRVDLLCFETKGRHHLNLSGPTKVKSLSSHKNILSE